MEVDEAIEESSAAAALPANLDSVHLSASTKESSEELTPGHASVPSHELVNGSAEHLDGEQTQPQSQPQLSTPSTNGQANRAVNDQTSPQYTLLYTVQGHHRSVSSLRFSPDGTLLVSAGADALLKIWSVRTGQLVHTLQGHDKGISDVAWSSDTNYVASASDDGTVRVWSANTGLPLRLLTGHTSYVLCVAYNPQSTLVVSGSFDETIRLWDVRRGVCHRTIAAHSEAVSSVAFNRDGTMIVSGSYDGLIRLWDTATGQCLKTLVYSDNAIVPVAGVSFSPSSAQLLVSTLDSTIRLWDIPNGRVLKTYKGHQKTKFAAPAALTAPLFRETPAAAPSRRNVVPTSSENLQPQDSATSTAINGAGLDVRALPNAYVISGSEDQRVYIWDVQSKKVVQTLAGHKDVVLAVDVHPKQPVIASASMDQDPSIKVWIDLSSFALASTPGMPGQPAAT